MESLKSNLKGELTLSQAIEHLLDTICSEMESNLILNSGCSLGWDINNLFQEKQMNLWIREGFKGEGMKRVNTAFIYHDH